MNRAKYSVSGLFIHPVRQAFEALADSKLLQEQNCLYRLDFRKPDGWLRVKQFTNGTLYLEGTSNSLWQQAMQVIESQLSIKTQKSVEPRLSTASSQTIQTIYIGTDESGKGDYFGPLVIAGVAYDPNVYQGLTLQDSKQLNDTQIRQIAQAIYQRDPQRVVLTVLLPQEYNQMYQAFKAQKQNLNHMLAQAHRNIISTLSERFPEIKQAVVDQFATDTQLVAAQFRTANLSILQMPKAEQHAGVAAASIIARDGFLAAMETLEQQWQCRLPLGAGSPVLQAGRTFIQQYGVSRLEHVAKLHFKTTQDIQT